MARCSPSGRRMTVKKLYEKNEILFAVFWIVLYTLSMGTLNKIGDDSPYRMIGLIGFSAAMLLFVWKNGLPEKYGLSRWAGNNRAMLCFLPLWVLTTVNLWGGITPRYSMPGQLFAVVSMAFVGFAEEMLFRGFLFKAMLKEGGVKTAVLVSTVSFGLGHILNLFSGHAPAETLMQVVFAVAYGFMVTLVFYKSKSLLPCILSHSLFDMFAEFSDLDASPLLNWLCHGVIIMLSILYGLYLIKHVDTPPTAGSDGQEAETRTAERARL